MEKLLMCRICLTTNVRKDSILKTHLQDTYEKLTMKQFETKDSRPILACYLCCARLLNCYQLSINCLQSEEFFTHMLSGSMLSHVNLQNNTGRLRLGMTPVVVETFEEPYSFDLDASGNPISGEEGVEVEMKVVVNQVLEDISEENIKIEPDDTFEDLELEDQIPIHIVKQNLSATAPSAPVLQPSALTTETNRTLSNINQFEEPKINSKVAVEDILQTNRKRCCDVKEFNNSENLSDHNDVEKDKSPNVSRPYSCDSCRNYFNTKYYLKKHNCTHTGDKPYQCIVCKKCFRYKSYLVAHIRIHTGVTQYQCLVCNKCFRYKSQLARHIRTHTGEKPYRCTVCNKCFSAKVNFKCHMRMHYG